MWILFLDSCAPWNLIYTVTSPRGRAGFKKLHYEAQFLEKILQSRVNFHWHLCPPETLISSVLKDIVRKMSTKLYQLKFNRVKSYVFLSSQFSSIPSSSPCCRAHSKHVAQVFVSQMRVRWWGRWDHHCSASAHCLHQRKPFLQRAAPGPRLRKTCRFFRPGTVAEVYAPLRVSTEPQSAGLHRSP